MRVFIFEKNSIEILSLHSFHPLKTKYDTQKKEEDDAKCWSIRLELDIRHTTAGSICVPFFFYYFLFHLKNRKKKVKATQTTSHNNNGFYLEITSSC
jgi:hypothetical protein